MKKIVILILSSAFLFNLFGYIWVYELLKLNNSLLIEKKINTGIPEKELLVLGFHKNDFSNQQLKWKIPGKEFEYLQNSYDIVSTDIKNDSVYFYCIHDINEDQIIHNYKAAVQKNNENTDNRRRANLICTKLSIDYFCQVERINFFYVTQIPIFYLYTQFYKSYSVEMPSPPPKYFI